MSKVEFTSYHMLSAMAGMIAGKLDAADKRVDGKIEGKRYNDYLARHLSGEKLEHFKTDKTQVTVDEIQNALASCIIAKYQFREDAKQNSQIDGLVMLDKIDVLMKAAEGIFNEKEINMLVEAKKSDYLKNKNEQTVECFKNASTTKKHQMIVLDLEVAPGDYFDSNDSGNYYKWNDSTQKFEKHKDVDYVSKAGTYVKAELKNPSREELDNPDLKGLSKEEQMEKIGLKKLNLECGEWYEQDLKPGQENMFDYGYYYWNNQHKIFVHCPEADYITDYGKKGPMKMKEKFDVVLSE